MGTEPSAIGHEIIRPHLGKEVVLGICVSGADSMENTMDGPEASATLERGNKSYEGSSVRT